MCVSVSAQFSITWARCVFAVTNYDSADCQCHHIIATYVASFPSMPPVLVRLPNIIFVHFSSSSHGIFTIERAISVSALTSSQMMKMMLVVIEILIKWWWKTCSQTVCTFLHYSWPHSSHVSDDIVTDTNWLLWCLDVYVCVCLHDIAGVSSFSSWPHPCEKHWLWIESFVP